MKYEIVNPSDPYTLEAEDPKVAISACLLLSEGHYGLKDDSGKTVCPILAFGGGEHFMVETFGGVDEYGSWLAENKVAIAAALETVTLASGERSSLNNIGARARDIAKKIRGSA